MDCSIVSTTSLETTKLVGLIVSTRLTHSGCIWEKRHTKKTKYQNRVL